MHSVRHLARRSVQAAGAEKQPATSLPRCTHSPVQLHPAREWKNVKGIQVQKQKVQIEKVQIEAAS